MTNSVLTIDIVTPEKKIFSGKCSFVVIPGSEGEMGILPGHAPILSRLRTGEIKVVNGTAVEYGLVSNGFVEVRENRISMVAEYAVMAGNIDAAEAEADRDSARNDLDLHKEESVRTAAEKKLKLATLKLSVAAKRTAVKT